MEHEHKQILELARYEGHRRQAVRKKCYPKRKYYKVR